MDGKPCLKCLQVKPNDSQHFPAHDQDKLRNVCRICFQAMKLSLKKGLRRPTVRLRAAPTKKIILPIPLPAGDWRPVPGLPGFMVSSGGDVWMVNAVSRGAGLRKTRIGTNGYLRFNCTRGGKPGTFEVHRAVALAFLGPPPFARAHAAHNDGNPLNNAVENIRWATPLENSKDRERHGRQNRRKLEAGQIAEIHGLFRAGLTAAAVARAKNISHKTALTLLRRHVDGIDRAA